MWNSRQIVELRVTQCRADDGVGSVTITITAMAEEDVA